MANSLPNDVDLVNLAAAIYDSTSKWDYYDNGDDDNVCVALKKFTGYDVVVFRGSIVVHDWLDDFYAIPAPTRIGMLHSGFYENMEKIWSELKPLLTHPVLVTGHSLGAARASILCGLMKVDGPAPVRRAVFGEPRPGMADFAKIIAEIPGASYRNTSKRFHDVVTDLPLKLLPPFNFIHPTDLVDVSCPPTGSIFNKVGLFAYHHIELYQTALAAYFKE